MSDLLYWIWLSELKNLGAVTALKYLDHFLSIQALYKASYEELCRVPESRPSEISSLCNKDLSRSHAILSKCQKAGIGIITIQECHYPRRLANIFDPPVLLYFIGELPDIDNEAVIGVVGTRRASNYGLKTAERISAEIAAGGGIVATGLAAGIDSASAEAAIKNGGIVIGVLGTGVDITYPAWNRKLQDNVSRHGIIISEYPPGTRATRGSFPSRNRIISGISLGVAIIEAPAKSGALITASRASEQGRDVFVVPGNIDLIGFQGSNELIRDGAALITSGWDILSQYEWRYPDKISKESESKHRNNYKHEALLSSSSRSVEAFSAKKEVDNKRSMEYIDLKEHADMLSGDEQDVIISMSGQTLHVDEIISRTMLGADRVLAALTLLEIKGYISAEEGKRFEPKITINRK